MAGRIRRELQVGKPLRSVDAELFLNLVLTAERVTRSEYRLLKEHGLQMAQYNVLRILRGAGPEGLPSGAIAERMITPEPDITRLLDRIEKQGLLRRWRCEEDRRVVRASITEAGLQRIAPLDRLLLANQQRLFRGMELRDKRLLIDLLERVRGSLER